MSASSAKRSSIKTFSKYNSALVGNAFTNPYTPNFEHIGTVTLASTQPSVTFTGLSNATGFKHLVIRYSARTDRSTADGDNIRFRFNSDSSALYSAHVLYANGNGSAYSANDLTQTSGILGDASAGNAPAGAFAVGACEILDAFSTTKNKTTRTSCGYIHSIAETELQSSQWMSTSAITSITLFPQLGSNIVANSRFSIYGVRG